jgi:putative addiction module killer protein
MYDIQHYLNSANKDVLTDWLRRLRDITAKVAIGRCINRMEMGNFGDHKFCRDGVWELRIDVGVGYRVYYAHAGREIILLLCAGGKPTQDADISCACEYWQDWKKRGNDEK